MINHIPEIDPKGVFNVKETCAILEICKDTLTDRRKKGLIIPIDRNARRFKYTGAAIRKFWRIENKQTSIL